MSESDISFYVTDILTENLPVKETKININNNDPIKFKNLKVTREMLPIFKKIFCMKKLYLQSPQHSYGD